MSATDSMATPAAVCTHDVRWELAAALRTFGRLGFEFGCSGHVSARAPEAPDHYWVNPLGVSISTVTRQDLVLVDNEGQVVDRRASHAIKGFRGNLRLHEEVAEANAVVHLHTPHGFAWSSLGRKLEAVNTDSALITELQGLSPWFWGATDGPSNVDLALDGVRVILQQGHGFVTLGQTVSEAAFYLIAAERAAHANLMLLGSPEKNVLPDHIIAKWSLTPDVAHAHFQTAFSREESSGIGEHRPGCRRQ